MTYDVFAVVEIQADAYVAIIDHEGPFVIRGTRCQIANARPIHSDRGPRWREGLLAGRISEIRWTVAVFDGRISDFCLGRDTAAVTALGATVWIA